MQVIFSEDFGTEGRGGYFDRCVDSPCLHFSDYSAQYFQSLLNEKVGLAG